MVSVLNAAHAEVVLDLNFEDEDNWVLDICCGTESMLVEARRRKWGYVGIDLEGEGRVEVVKGRLEARLIMKLDPSFSLSAIFHCVYVNTGLVPQTCQLVWYSPPCEFYSFLNRPSRRHRFWHLKGLPPLPGLPTVVDDMIKAMVQDTSWM